MPSIEEFEGRWRIARRIDDRRAGAEGRFDGEVVIARGGDGWVYDETGSLSLGAGAPLTATRRYLWQALADGRIAVSFADGRPFHVFDPSAPVPEADHRCQPDFYRVRYDFTAWPDWAAEWEVTGPRKDYRMVSTYRRA
ncbi:DUF6314 family protein [Acidimangrovimonas pyrenivorans]|uniref:DUF6314 family protein n=1 Tax=Acidimangrovimonas pyrenivorans TaxID=2030798 RepID=A0ABV7AJ90_9RHOB